MKTRIVTLLLAVCASIGLVAQDGKGTKILVFRNSGEINVFNSDSISKVELSVFDADSVEHSDYVSHVFYHMSRQPMVIPLTDIDSVAFGVRNIIEPKKGVRKLSDEEAEGISSFDGEILAYDSRLKLTAGEIVY